MAYSKNLRPGVVILIRCPPLTVPRPFQQPDSGINSTEIGELLQ